MTRGDQGFTLVEVMAAMVVFALVSTAVTGMFASGLRASLLTKMETTAKNLGQQRFETIRNLPFHIDQVTGDNNPSDLLDTYYPTMSVAAAGRGKPGYVSAGSQRWKEDGDPVQGAFYRFVLLEVPGYPQFTQYVATQFLDDSGNAFNPTSFEAKVVGFDMPPTNAVGVTVTTLWRAGRNERVSRVHSQISAGRADKPKAVLQSKLTALRLTGGLSAPVAGTGGRTVSVELASLAADGSLSRTVTAAQSLRAAVLGLSTGVSVNGAITTAKAPPNSGTLGNGAGPKDLVDGSVVRGTVGTTHTQNVLASSSTGQIVLSSQSAPARADVLGGGVGQKISTISIDTSGVERLQLLGEHAYLEDAGCGTSCANAGVTGWANTLSSSTAKTTQTSANAFVRGALVFMPTAYAPLGLVRVKLTSATVACKVTRTTSTPVPTADITYTGSLSYWAPFSPYASMGYVTVPLSSADPVSPLTPSILANTQVGTDSNGQPLWLSDYIASWTSMDAPTVAAAKTVGSDQTTVTTSFSGMIGIASKPLRATDPSSVVAAELAPGGCTAEEYR